MREIQAKSKAANKVRPCRHIQQHELNLIPVSYLHPEKRNDNQIKCQTKCEKFRQHQSSKQSETTLPTHLTT
eukprot:scaffold97494_cov45-Attheya_sp.AAC.1